MGAEAKTPWDALPWSIPAHREGCVGHGLPAHHHPVNKAQDCDIVCVSFPSGYTSEPPPWHTGTHGAGSAGQSWLGWGSRAAMGSTSHSPHSHRTSERIQERGLLPAAGRGAGGWCPAEPPAPTASPAAPSRSGKPESSIPSLALQTQPGRSRALLASAALASAAHAPAAVHAQNGCETPCEPRAGRVCRWEGLRAAGTDVGNAQHMLLHVLPVFFPFSASSY